MSQIPLQGLFGPQKSIFHPPWTMVNISIGPKSNQIQQWYIPGKPLSIQKLYSHEYQPHSQGPGLTFSNARPPGKKYLFQPVGAISEAGRMGVIGLPGHITPHPGYGQQPLRNLLQKFQEYYQSDHSEREQEQTNDIPENLPWLLLIYHESLNQLQTTFMGFHK